MLRKMLGSGRRHTVPDTDSDVEPVSSCDEGIHDQDDGRHLGSWADWISRTTRTAEEHARLAGVRDWVTELARRKWIWAGHVIRRVDECWSKVVLKWIPAYGSRKRGRPALRWVDAIDDFFRVKFVLERGV